jgi:hypothetical protein
VCSMREAWAEQTARPAERIPVDERRGAWEC